MSRPKRGLGPGISRNVDRNRVLGVSPELAGVCEVAGAGDEGCAVECAQGEASGSGGAFPCPHGSFLDPVTSGAGPQGSSAGEAQSLVGGGGGSREGYPEF